MANNEEGDENVPRGNEWEVVSLTASTYAAAPGPREVELKDGEMINTQVGDKAETSRALFLSGHFIFPPSQHENLPLEPDRGEICDEQGGRDLVSELAALEGGKYSGKDEENWGSKECNVPDEFPGVQFSDEKDKLLSIHGEEFDGMTLHGANLVDKEQNPYITSKYSSFHSETALSESVTFSEDISNPGQIEPSPAISETPRLDDKGDKSGIPREAWWRRRAASLYTHAKEANAFWSIFVAAAVMGLVILGKRWQQERWQTLQLKWQMSVNDQKPSKVLGPITGLKDMIVVGQRSGAFIKSSSASSI